MQAAVSEKITPKYPVIDVPVAEIALDPRFENVRIDRRMDLGDPLGAQLYSGKIANLAEDIRDHGLFHPITVRARSPSDYVLRAGFRRFLAVKLLDWKDVQASIIPEEAPEEIDYWINIQENLEREDLSAFEVAEAAIRMQTLFGRTGSDFARETRRSPSYINNLIRWRKTLPENVISDWRRGHPWLTQDRLEKLSHLAEDEAEAKWQMLRGKKEIAVKAGPTTERDPSIPAKRPSGSRLGDLKSAIENSSRIRAPHVRTLALQIVEFCQGERKEIPGIYPTTPTTKRRK